MFTAFHILVVLLALVFSVSATFSWRGLVVQQVQRQRREPWTAMRHAILARETVARVLFSAIALLGRVQPPLPTEAGLRTVVLVPDPATGRAAMWFLEIFLRHRGYQVWSLRSHRTADSLADHASDVGRRIEAATRALKLNRVDVVAFGVGGLIAGWWIHHLNGERFVRRLVTIGTPWRGTKMAVFTSGALALETGPDAHDLDDLVPPCAPTLSIWCPDDPAVVPANSAAAEMEHSVAIEGAGHLGMLLSARTFRAVQAGLDEPISGIAP